MMPRLIFSLAESSRPMAECATPSPAVARALRAMNERRLCKCLMRSLLVAEDFPNVDVLEPEWTAMVLQLNLPGGIDRFLSFPIILQNRISHDHLAVQKDVHLLSHY